MEIIGILILAFVVLYVAQGAFGRVSGPKSDNHFVCSSCGLRKKHNNRTLKAWNNGLRTPVCSSCHSRWLQAQAEARKAKMKATVVGCLVVLAIVIVFVIIASQ